MEGTRKPAPRAYSRCTFDAYTSILNTRPDRFRRAKQERTSGVRVALRSGITMALGQDLALGDTSVRVRCPSKDFSKKMQQARWFDSLRLPLQVSV